MPDNPNIIRNFIRFLAFIVLFSSCNGKKHDAYDEMPPLHPPTAIVRLNLEEGYTINPVTGDSIEPVINSLGDTLITGIPVPVKGKVIDPALVAQAEVYPVNKPDIVKAHQNVHEIIEPLNVVPLDKERLHLINSHNLNSQFVLVNSRGDTAITGLPIPVSGKNVPCIQPEPVNALPPRIKHNAIMDLQCLDVEQGLNSSTVRSMIQDNRGNLWIGTDGGGLCKYDGQTFTQYTTEEGLCHNTVTSLLEDNKGNLWIGTGEGVCKFDGDHFTHFTEKEGLGRHLIRSILQDRNGNIWFGTWRGGVIKYDGRTITNYTVREGLGSYDVISMMEDRRGNIWFGHIFGGVTMYDGENFTHYTEEAGLSNKQVWTIMEDSKGNIWFGTSRGACIFDGESFTQISEKEGLSEILVWSIIEDRYGQFWFGTRKGACMYNGSSITQFTEKEGTTEGTVNAIIEDSEGNIWFGTRDEGLITYTPGSFVHFTEDEGLSHTYINHILEDSSGDIWFSGKWEGASVYDGSTFRHMFGDFPFDCIAFMYEDRNNNLWIGGETGRGLGMFDGENLTFYADKEGYGAGSVQTIIEDSNGQIWIAGSQGVNMFDGETFTHFTERQGLCDNGVGSIVEDRNGQLWLGTKNGLCRYDGESFTHITEKEGLSNNHINCMFEDSTGKLLLGTEGGGVNIFDGYSFTYITQEQGLSDNVIKSIEEDGDGNLWIGTLTGLNRVVIDKNSQALIYSLTEQDGIKGMDFKQNSVALDSKNRLWWGTNKSLSMLDLNQYQIPQKAPKNLILQRLDINGRFVDYRHVAEVNQERIEFDSVALFGNYPINLELPFRLNHLTFYVSAIDFAAPHKVKYSYMIQGLDNEWSQPSPESRAEYRNLPYGTYTFIVRAIGAAQKWGDPFELSFKIHPPWWFAWWAYIIYGIILAGILHQYRRFLLRRAKLRSDVEIERIEKEKILELDHLKSRFFANVSHEFRTPLTLILGPIERLLNKNNRELVVQREELGIIRRNARRLQQLINQILDISKLETGKVMLQVSEGDLSEFVKRIIFSFLSLAESKSIVYQHNLPESPGSVYFDREKLEKIITNLVSNAFKFTPPGGEIEIELKYINAEGGDVPQKAEFTIRDSGTGIPLDQIEKIFDRFYRVDDGNTRDHEGTGIGLALTRELVDIYRGGISVESEPGQGSLFRVVLPISKGQFKAEEILTSPEADLKSLDSQLEEFTDVSAETVVSDTGEMASSDDAERQLILVVEDNVDLRQYISGILEEEFRIIVAENGREGLSLAVDETPDLVITDLMMPEMDGIELCKQMRVDQRTDHIPIVMLTAKADKDSKLEGLEEGADEYMIKPFDAEELLVRVNNLIRQRKNLKDKYQAEFIKNDPFTREIPALEDDFLSKVVDCILENLGEHEFGVEQLARNVGFSRSQLHRKIRSLTGYVPTRFIRYIRLKQAARMFNEGNSNITQVLYTVGFNSPSRFSQYFRDFFGVNPSEYLKQRGNTSE